MDKNLAQINMQLSAMEKSKDAMDAIVTIVKNTSQDAKQVYDMYGKIQEMLLSFDYTLVQISDVISSNANYSQEIAASTLDQHKSVLGVSSSAARLSTVADTMLEDIGRYKTE